MSDFREKLHIPQKLWLVISKNEMVFKSPNMVANSQQPLVESCDQNKMTEYCKSVRVWSMKHTNLRMDTAEISWILTTEKCLINQRM